MDDNEIAATALMKRPAREHSKVILFYDSLRGTKTEVDYVVAVKLITDFRWAR